MRNPWRWRRALIYVWMIGSIVGPLKFPDDAWGSAAWMFVVWWWFDTRLDRLRDDERLERGSAEPPAKGRGSYRVT